MLRGKLVATTVATAVVIGVLLVTSVQAHVPANTVNCGPQVVNQGTGFDNSYRYRVIEDGCARSLRAQVHVDFDDPRISARYAAANRALATQLIQRQAGPVPVTITFAQPLSLSDAQAIVDKIGMKLTSYWLGATKASGAKASIFRWPQDQRIESYATLEADTLKPRAYSLKGVMVLVGEIDSTSAGLGALLGDQRVHLLDVVASDIRRQAQHELGERADTIQVAAPSPYWTLDWK